MIGANMKMVDDLFKTR